MPTPTATTGGMPMKSDVLIVGAGSAGCVLAARLSEDPAREVILIEAGAPASDPDIAVPQMWPMLGGRSYDWRYLTVPQPGTDGRVHEWPRGRLIGGSSAINALAHVRGAREDFEPCRDATGSARWSYEGLLPAFRRMEDFPAGADAQHGQGGPLPLLLPDSELSPVVRAYMRAALALGIAWRGDHNRGALLGVAPNTLTLRAGRRVTAADAYLAPVQGRPNLTVLPSGRVHTLLVDRGRVLGIRADLEGRPVTLHAGTTILCAGAIGSPTLLMRSGIGPAADLERVGVRSRLDLPAVGANLHDHLLTAGNVYRARQPVPRSRLQHSESLTYLHSEDPSRAAGVPDIVVGCVAAPAVTECFERPEPGTVFTLLSGVTHPLSRGRITLSGPHLEHPPLIDPAYLENEEDRRLARRALEMARSIGRQAALDEWRAEELLPGPACRSEAELDAFVRKASMTHHHPVGTCSMGTVVDADLRLRGVEGVHIVDASVIPSILSGPIHAAVLAIAETFASEVAAAWT